VLGERCTPPPSVSFPLLRLILLRAPRWDVCTERLAVDNAVLGDTFTSNVDVAEDGLAVYSMALPIWGNRTSIYDIHAHSSNTDPG